MAYKVIWEQRALKELKKVHKMTADKIMTRVEVHLAQNPEKLGKVLIGKFAGFYRYRYGDYRIVYGILKQQITIVIVKIGHRSEVYE